MLCLAIVVGLCWCANPALATPPDVPEPPGTAQLCGVRCLHAALARLGVPVELGSLVEALPHATESGTSLHDLEMVATSKGLYAVSAKVSADELASLGVLTIAHTWGGHFVLAEPDGRGSLQVTDPSSPQATMTDQQFRYRYAGFALLIAKSMLSLSDTTPGQPDLRLQEYCHDLGFVDPGRTIELAVELRNAGPAELAISKVEPSCSCTVAFVESRRIAPGGRTQLRSRLDTSGLRGGTVTRVRVHSNDPVTPVAELWVTGIVRPDRLSIFPKTLSFGQVRRGERRAVRAYLPDASAGTSNWSDEKLEVLKVSSDKPCVTARVVEIPGKRHACYVIEAELLPSAPVGPVSGTLVLQTTHATQPELTVPFLGDVRGGIDVRPDQVFLGIAKKGDQKQCAVSISTASDRPLAIDRIDSSLPCLSIEVRPKLEGKEYTLTATLKPQAPLGNIKGEVTIHTNDPGQPLIKVPVYAYVQPSAPDVR